MNEDFNNLLTLLLGGGLVTTIAAFFKGFKSIKDGSRNREKSTIEDLVTQRATAIKEREEESEAKNYAYDQRDYWRNWSGDLEFLMRSQGLEVPPRPPDPTKDIDK